MFGFRRESDNESRELVRASVHEAGHSIAAAEFGFRPSRAMIQLVNVGWFQVAGCGVTCLDRVDLRDKHNLAVTLYAGAAAEALVIHMVEGTPLRRALRDALPTAWSDYEKAEALFEGSFFASARRSSAERAAAEFVDDNWVEIDFIAEQLRIQGEVEYRPERRQA
jgi:hypothetical protein